jgi:MFS-type transporter involved in bile tolerance (Atg22 family)
MSIDLILHILAFFCFVLAFLIPRLTDRVQGWELIALTLAFWVLAAGIVN